MGAGLSSSFAARPFGHARAVADDAADTLPGHAGKAGGATEVLGMLMLTAAYACWRQGARSEAADYLEQARRIAVRTGDSMTLSMFFGPTNISIWQIGMEAHGGDPGRAVALARQTKPRDVPHVQRQATYYLDTGHALARLDREDEAIRTLIEAERLAPAHVRGNPSFVDTVRSLVDTRKRKAVPSDARALCARLGIAV